MALNGSAALVVDEPQTTGRFAPARRSNRVGRLRTQHILAQFRDGQWHYLREIVAAVECEASVVREICNRLVQRGHYQTFGERHPAPASQGGYAYRFVKGGAQKLNLAAFYQEVQPVLDAMDTLIHGPRVDFSQTAMQVVYAQFRKTIDRMAR